MTAPSSLDLKNAQQSRRPSFWIANAALIVLFALASQALHFPDRIELWLALVVIAIVGVTAKLVQRKLQSTSPELIQILALYAISFFLPASYNQTSFFRIEPEWDGSTLDYFRVAQLVSQFGADVFFGSFLSLVCLNPVWLANAIWYVGVYLLWVEQQWKLAAVAGLLSTSLALCGLFLLDSDWLFVIAPGTQTFKVRIGYYVWFGSMFLLTVSALLWPVSHSQIREQYKLSIHKGLE